jgi:hypothetical protein
MTTFIVDCPQCKAKVAANQTGEAEHKYYDDENGEPFAERLLVGKCPRCNTLISAQTEQIHFDGFNADYDGWSEPVRVYPKPSKIFSSYRIPNTAKLSLTEGDNSLQANAASAACVMFGRALEAVCRDMLLTPEEKKSGTKRKIMLGAGIKQLRDKDIIDNRLFDWSQDLQAFRNLAAHPDDDVVISRQDAEDLQAFVHAIIEYIYDLADRYNEFKTRQQQRRAPRVAKVL